MNNQESIARTLVQRVEEPLTWIINQKEIDPHIFSCAVRAMDAQKELKLLLEKEKPKTKWAQQQLALE